MGILILATVLAWAGALGWLWSALRHGRGLVSRLQRLLHASLSAALGLLLGGSVVLLRVAQVFSGDTLVAQVTAQRLGPDEFELIYQPVGAGGARHVRLRGDQWAISGGLIKWSPWLTAMGFKSYHQPLRLSGRFASSARERAAPPTLEDLGAGMDRLWEVLYWLGDRLPGLDAVYGSSAYAYVEPGAVQEVSVSPTGYLIRRKAR